MKLNICTARAKTYDKIAWMPLRNYFTACFVARLHTYNLISAVSPGFAAEHFGRTHFFNMANDDGAPDTRAQEVVAEPTRMGR